MQSLLEHREPRGTTSSIILEFPTLSVAGTPSDWLSQSQRVDMASSVDDSSIDDTASSLGDSTYDFIDDRSTTTDDEEASNLTRSIYSNEAEVTEGDDSGAEGVESLQDSCETSKGSSDKAVHKEHSARSNTPISEASEDHDVSEINLHERTSSPHGMSSATEGTYDLGYFSCASLHRSDNAASCHRVKNHNPHGLSAKIYVSMIKKNLALERPYKVLYAGDMWAREAILKKVGSILAVSLNEDVAPQAQDKYSRFNVVPISSFGAQSRDVMLVGSVGLEMSVEDCMAAHSAGSSISLSLSTGQTVTKEWSSQFEANVTSSGWRLPDLAVIFISIDDSASRAKGREVYRFMSSSHVPCIVVTDDSWTTGILDPVCRIPHVLLKPGSEDSCLGRPARHPLPLELFLNLNSSQLNKNLAYQVARKRLCTLARQDPSKSRSDLTEPVKSFWAKLMYFETDTPVTYMQRNLGLLKLFVLLETFALAALLWLVYGIQASHEPGQGLSSNPQISSSVQLTKHQVTPFATSVTSSALASSTPVPEVKSLSPSSTDLAALLLDPSALKPNSSVNFLVHVVGDQHIVIRPPQWFSQRRLSPKINFQVARRKGLIEHQVSTLFEGIYSVRIPRNEAYGKMNVSVWTTSKPRIKEQYEVDFGNPWLRIDSMRRAADTIKNTISKDLAVFQNGLSTVYSSTSSELQEFVRDATVAAGRVNKGIRHLQAMSLNRTAQSAEVMKSQSRALTLTVAKVIGRPAGRLRNVVLVVERKRQTQNAAARATVARVYHRARNSHSIGRMIGRLQDVQKKHVSNTQKRLLKAWWRATTSRKQYRQPVSCTKRRGHIGSKKVRCS